MCGLSEWLNGHRSCDCGSEEHESKDYKPKQFLIYCHDLSNMGATVTFIEWIAELRVASCLRFFATNVLMDPQSFAFSPSRVERQPCSSPRQFPVRAGCTNPGPHSHKINLLPYMHTCCLARRGPTLHNSLGFARRIIHRRQNK